MPLKVRDQSGQAILILMAVIGVLLSMVVFFGRSRSAEFNKNVGRLENDLAVNDVFMMAARKLQVIYSSEAGCDPDRLNTIINNWDVLPNAYANGVAWAIANPSGTTIAEKQGLCSGGVGCRQLGTELGGRGYIVTVGQIDFGSNATTTAGVIDTTGACSRDTSINLRMVLEGASYSRFVTLINLCSMKSCTGPSFTGSDADVSTSTAQTTQCTGANGATLPARIYGDFLLDSTGNKVTLDEILWARRFLETGGTSQGVTEFLYTTSSPSSGNATCDASTSSGQCIARNCIPALDLDLNRNNDEIDLGILEMFVRGFINKIPVRDF